MKTLFNSLIRSLTVCVASCLGLATSSHAQVFSNSNPINCPAGTNYPSLYPSVITVPLSGVNGNVVRRVAVTIKGFSHTWLSDAQILLVPPVGAPITLLANNMGAGDASNATVTFFAEAPAAIPGPGSNLPSGAYVPNPNGDYGFFAPAPSGPYTGTLAALSGSASNGNWSLYVADSFAASDPLSITGGWELEFFGDPTPTPTAFTYQGKLNPGVTGPISARFSVWQSASSSSIAMRLLGPLTVSAIPANQGVFTANVDFGKLLPGDRALWLEVEVESPAGSGFVKLTPRQPLTVPPVISGGWNTQLETVGSAASVSTASRVGIGVLKPSMSLQVASPSSLSNLPTIGLTNGTNFLYASLPGAGSPPSIIWNNGVALRFAVESSLGSNYTELMRVDGTGNVAIGTDSPAAKLDVRGNIRFGPSSQYTPVGGTENLHIKRGSVSALGTITGGTGFTVTRTGLGLYRIQWAAANGFGDFPTFTGNAIGGGVIVSTTSGVINPDSSGYVDVRCTFFNGTLIDSAFTFTLIGNR